MSPHPDTPNGQRAVGRCLLVGAGPGDPELLTVKALKAIQQATVLLVDDLVTEALIDYALEGLPARPRIVHVGKRGGCASTPQAFIQRLMVAEASKGETVVRLKGGDPFIFGRGGEEVQALRAHGIPVQIVNGITAGLAAATALGVPLTHRRHAQGVVFVTGHAREGGDGPDWPSLAQAAAHGLTLVIYMGVTQSAHLQAGLLTALPGHTPVAIVEHASLPQERRTDTTLAELSATIAQQAISSPAVILVGDVLLARQSMATAQPLSARG